MRTGSSLTTWQFGDPIQGNPAFLLGTSYMTVGRSVRMWEDWNAPQVRQDFAAMASMGLNTTKIYLFWNYFLPSPQEGLNPTALSRLDEMLAIAHENGIGLIIDLIIGHMSGENYIATWTEGRDLMTDPTALRGQAEYIFAMTSRYRGDSRILAWDVCSEILLYKLGREGRDPRFPVLFAGSSVGVLGEPPKQSESWLWLKTLTDAARAGDPTHPVYTGVGTPKGFALRDVAALCDCTACYGYDWGENYSGNSYLCGFERALSAAWRLPCLVEEFGVSKSWNSEEYEAAYYNRVYYSSLLNGCLGALSWQFCDFDSVKTRDPYLYFDWEIRFGMVRDDGTEGLCCRVTRDFSAFLRSCAMDGLRLPEDDLKILLCECYDEAHTFNSAGDQQERGDYYELYRRFRDAGLRVSFLREGDDFSAARAIFVPASGARKIKSDTWIKLADYVKSGGKLIREMTGVPQGHNLTELFGAHPHVTMRYAQRRVIFADTSMTDLSLPAEVTMPVVRAAQQDVAARDEDGNPVVIRHTLGAGKTLLIGVPLSRFSAKARVNGGDDAYQAVYSFLRDEMDIVPAATAERPCVETGVFVDAQGAPRLLIAVNHRPLETVSGEIRLGIPIQSAVDMDTGAPVPVRHDDNGCAVAYCLPAGAAMKLHLTVQEKDGV